MMKLPAAGLLLFALGAPASPAGPLIIGVRAGAPFTDILDSVSEGDVRTATRDYVVGPTVGLKLPAGFSVEADALFQRIDIDATTDESQVLSVSASAWQFPVMLKFAPGGAVAPMIGAGVAVRHLRDFGDVGDYLTGDSGESLVNRNTVGVVIGGGLMLRTGGVRITPEIRYTRWGSNSISEGFRQFLTGNKNDAMFLVGLTF